MIIELEITEEQITALQRKESVVWSIRGGMVKLTPEVKEETEDIFDFHRD